MITGGAGYYVVRKPAGYLGSTLIWGRYVYEHRLIMEHVLGRLLRPDEVVHHCNGDRLDNRPENLDLMTKAQHLRHHNRMRGKKVAVMRCPCCGSLFERARNETHLVKHGPVATYCSRVCAGVGRMHGQENVIAEYRVFPDGTRVPIGQ